MQACTTTRIRSPMHTKHRYYRMPQIGLNVGAGVNLTDKISVDASYLFIPFKQRTITNSAFGFNGTYNTTANLIGIDISYKLGGE